jgi:phenylpyruvate tautomerase PptA (4-oxalocrotonate tautomerase family)
MPHVLVKLYAGRSEQQRKQLAAAVTKAVTGTLHYGDESVSVAIEDVPPERWRPSTSRTSSARAARCTRSLDTIPFGDVGPTYTKSLAGPHVPTSAEAGSPWKLVSRGGEWTPTRAQAFPSSDST